jgi:uncharacterized protein YdhG (YjbR/CyaY superfamily)
MAQEKKSTKRTAESEGSYAGFSEEEREAMRDHAKELKASSRGGSKAEKAAEEAAAVVEKIAGFDEPDRVLGERFHALVRQNAPELAPRLWYGMPAYARDGKIVCHFQPAQKFKARYATIGFSDAAHLDDGAFWPVGYALTTLSAADEKRIAALIKQAAG